MTKCEHVAHIFKQFILRICLLNLIMKHYPPVMSLMYIYILSTNLCKYYHDQLTHLPYQCLFAMYFGWYIITTVNSNLLHSYILGKVGGDLHYPKTFRKISIICFFVLLYYSSVFYRQSAISSIRWRKET